VTRQGGNIFRQAGPWGKIFYHPGACINRMALKFLVIGKYMLWHDACFSILAIRFQGFT